MFRDESKNINDEGRPILDETDVYGPKKYLKAFQLLRDWIENSLQLYKVNVMGSLIDPNLTEETLVRARQAPLALFRLFVDGID